MKREKGFTLIELVMVIVILGILAAVAMPKYVNMQDEAKSAAAKGVIGTVRSAIAIQYAKNALAGNATFPTGAELIATDGTGIFAENKMPDSPVPKIPANGLNSVDSTTVSGANTQIADADCDGSTAYVYNQDSGEIRFSNTDTDRITNKQWNQF
jgi:prepilin-type N-terminal cleavage/methylation domain-containing protein